jgi:hypothetical protein
MKELPRERMRKNPEAEKNINNYFLKQITSSIS